MASFDAREPEGNGLCFVLLQEGHAPAAGSEPVQLVRQAELPRYIFTVVSSWDSYLGNWRDQWSRD
jgi:hypothetical protein